MVRNSSRGEIDRHADPGGKREGERDEGGREREEEKEGEGDQGRLGS